MSGTSFEWTSTTLIDRVREWVLDLEEFPQALSAARKLDDRGQSWSQYEELLQPNRSMEWADRSQSLISRIREQLFDDTGITVLRCGATMPGNQARLVELLVGCALGKNVTKNAGTIKRPLFQATQSKDTTVGSSYLGNALKGNAIGLHTDASGTIDRKVEVLSMLYVRPARFGGQSVVASSRFAFTRLSEPAREILQRSFPRQSPYKDKDNPSKLLLCIPIFNDVRSGAISEMEFSYHPARLRNGVKLARSSKQELEGVNYDADRIVDKLTDEERSALGELDQALVEGACEISLMANDILLLNNQIVTHDRRPFWDDPRTPRLMERFWAGKFRTGEGPYHPVGEAFCASCC
jgi:alpha-ketoglutarate-dependent taurine dioxygenase